MSQQYICYPYIWEKDGIRIQPTSELLSDLTYFDFGYEEWKVPFVIPAKSPAEKTRILCLSHAEYFDGKEDDKWIKSFTNVKELQLHFGALDRPKRPDMVECRLSRPGGIFAHALQLPSEQVKYLTLVSTDTIPSKEVFDFISSFPHLEYLRVGNWKTKANDCYAIDLPQILDKPLTGTFVYEGDQDFIQNLSQGETGFKFQEIVQRRVPKSSSSGVKNLVEACSGTLTRIRIHGCKSSSDPCEIGPVSDHVLICSNST